MAQQKTTVTSESKTKPKAKAQTNGTPVAEERKSTPRPSRSLTSPSARSRTDAVQEHRGEGP